MRFKEAPSVAAWAVIRRHPVVLFDLDGTLVDTREGILRTWAAALDTVGIHGTTDFAERILSLPAAQAARILADAGGEQMAEALLGAFVQHYDDWGWTLSPPFPGVADALQELSSGGAHLHVVTNKRGVAARRVIGKQQWDHLFRSIDCSDDDTLTPRSKQESIRRVLARWHIRPAESVYVGDTEDDRVAALANGVTFIPAWWGDFHPSDALLAGGRPGMETMQEAG